MKNIAISVLTRGYSDLFQYNQLIQRNNLIFENILQKSEFKFDLIIFHEGNITEEQQLYITNLSKSKLIFNDVRTSGNGEAFNDKKNIINYDLCPPTPQSQFFPLGYKHMCHFWSIDFFEYLKDYDYVIRIDEDCFIESFDFNSLSELIDGDIKFISPYFQGQDEDYVIVGLEKLWNDFISDTGISPFMNFKDITCPYTNFMMLNLKFFRDNNIIQDFLSYVEKSHGIYSNRWGDLPIWGVILSTLTDKNLYKESKKIKYYHSSHNKKIN
jgi:hypothetical protein